MNKIGIIASVGAFTAASIAVAQGVGGLHGEHKGNLTRLEVLQRADTAFQSLDVNRDGRINPAEAQRVHEQMRGSMAGAHAKDPSGHSRQPDMHGFSDRLSRNGSSVTKAEFRQLHLKLFARHDRDRNGVLTAAEHRRLRAQFGH